MQWEVEHTDEFEAWRDSPTKGEQESIRASVMLLGNRAPNLKFPHSRGIGTSQPKPCRRPNYLNPCTSTKLLYRRLSGTEVYIST